MREGLIFKPQQQPQRPDNIIPPNILFLEKIARLEAELKELKKQIAVADEEKIEFLKIRSLDIKKQIDNYHRSLGKYRKTDKFNSLKELAGEEKVAEVIDFKSRNQRPETESAGVGNNFLKDLEEFKNKKRADSQNQ